MKVFISWSGDTGNQIAVALAKWLNKIMPEFNFFTSQTIKVGAKWRDEIINNLKEADALLLCITAESLSSQWCLFEAGFMAEKKIFPLLFQVNNSNIPEPLKDLQAKAFNQSEIENIIEILINLKNLQSTKDQIIVKMYKYWKELKDEMDNILNSSNPINDSKSELDRNDKLPTDANGQRIDIDPFFIEENILVLKERNFLTRLYFQKSQDAKQIDIITLSMRYFFESCEKSLEKWIIEGKNIRILTLAPSACTTVIRGYQEKRDYKYLKTKIESECFRCKAFFERFYKNNNHFEGSFEVKMHFEIPYYAYFRADNVLIFGLYYKQHTGVDSEALFITDKNKLFKNMTGHFDQMWDSLNSSNPFSSHLICTISNREKSIFKDSKSLEWIPPFMKICPKDGQ